MEARSHKIRKAESPTRGWQPHSILVNKSSTVRFRRASVWSFRITMAQPEFHVSYPGPKLFVRLVWWRVLAFLDDQPVVRRLP
jgi:hypothetical protein